MGLSVDIQADPNYDGGQPIRWLRLSDKPPRNSSTVEGTRRVDVEAVKQALREGFVTRDAAKHCGVGRDTVLSIRQEMLDSGEL